MLYLTDETPQTWRTIARVISGREPVDLVVFLYPETEISALLPPFADAGQEEGLERVTTYGDGEMPHHCARLPVTEELLERLEQVRGTLEDSCDSFVLYPRKNTEWLACSIPHEGICLVKDSALESELRALGLAPSSEAPSWW